MPRHPLYLIALMPPEEIRKEITAFKQFLADHWDARHAFNSPPHITLQPPFAWPDAQLPELLGLLAAFGQKQRSFYIELNGFGAFPPRVLFVKPVQNQDLERLFLHLIEAMETQLRYSDERNTKRPFHPHLTIAHRDLQEGDFPAAWAHFCEKEYQRVFRAEALVLLKHTAGKWEVFRVFPFS